VDDVHGGDGFTPNDIAAVAKHRLSCGLVRRFGVG
jgi:hypothetical protein